jgi:hypothetical protein
MSKTVIYIDKTKEEYRGGLQDCILWTEEMTEEFLMEKYGDLWYIVDDVNHYETVSNYITDIEDIVEVIFTVETSVVLLMFWYAYNYFDRFKELVEATPRQMEWFDPMVKEIIAIGKYPCKESVERMMSAIEEGEASEV